MTAVEEAVFGVVQEAVVIDASSKVGVVEPDLLVGIEGRGRL